MNPGIVEETGKVATGVIESLKTQPLTLALIVFNAIFIIAIFFAGKDQREQTNEVLKIMIENQKEAQKLLFQCVPQTRGQSEGFKLQSDDMRRVPLPPLKPEEIR